MRERKVGCFDADLNPFSEDHCGFDSRPMSVETCNAQPCNRPQSEPNVDCGVFWLEYLCFSAIIALFLASGSKHPGLRGW